MRAFVDLLAELKVVMARGEFSQTLAGSEKSRGLGREEARRFADPFPEYIKRRANFPSFGLTHSLAHTHSLSLAETRDRNEAVWLMLRLSVSGSGHYMTTEGTEIHWTE